MNRRNFLKLASAVPFVGLIPTRRVAANTGQNSHSFSLHDVSLDYPGNAGLVVCKDFGSVKSSIDKFAEHPAASHVCYTRHVEYSNGSRVLFQTAGECGMSCRSLNLGWVAIDVEIKNPPLVQILRCRLRRKGVPHQWFRFSGNKVEESPITDPSSLKGVMKCFG